MARRSNDEGSIYYSEADRCWYAQLPPDDHGRRPKRRAKTKREALEKLRALQAERRQGLQLGTKTPTIAEFLDIWLSQVVKRTVKPATHHNYRQYARLYVVPALGRVRVKDVTTPQIQQMVNDLADRLSPGTARCAHQCLRAALVVAVEWKYRADNAADGVKLPRLPQSTIAAITIDQARRVLAVVEGHRLATLYYLLLILGLRKGEVLGLRWRDLNWDKAELTIAQQVQTIDGETRIGTPKTKSSARTVPVPPLTLARLRALWKNQQEERRLLGTDWKEHGLIFPSEVGTPKAPRNLNRHFYGVQKAAGLKDVRLHDLRHTCGTLLGDLGVPELVIAQLLGHSSRSVTSRYVHPTMTAMRDAVNKVEQLLLGETETRISEATL